MTMTYANSPRPTYSPWGAIQSATQIIPGAWQVETASHGGIILSPERMAGLPESMLGLNRYGKGNAFEEDCEWAIVAMAFPAEFGAAFPNAMPAAERTFSRYYSAKVEA
jgi:hypothetical protein